MGDVFEGFRPPGGPEDELARRLGIERSLFLEIYGAGWEKLEQPSWEWPFELEEQELWFIAGSPPQLMLQISGRTVTVARPVGRCGGHMLSYEPTASQELTGEAEADKKVIASLLSTRRSSFRYCTFCRSVTPPERRLGSVCMGCSSEWLGVVY